ncbi:MAG: hypothetical protein BA874_06330 [Desulfuromonadales bacterium C00003068]|jgi:hypothetical protein|nr:MAG: hypothetical protein BA874_06330 [Desulfuromonadales bacterium C00003068]
MVCPHGHKSCAGNAQNGQETARRKQRQISLDMAEMSATELKNILQDSYRRFLTDIQIEGK